MILTKPPTGGQEILRHAFARRWKSIVAATLGGLAVGAGAVFALPVDHTATVTMTITPPAATPTPVAKTSINSTDMVTELGIAKSANVLDAAATAIGGTDAKTLLAGMEVSGDTNGTIVRIEYSARSRDEAVAAADAIAAAYLKERTALAEARADEMLAGITARVDELNTELSQIQAQQAAQEPDDEDTGLGNNARGAQRNQPVQQTSSAETARIAQLRAEIDKLMDQAVQLAPYHVTAGRVLTAAGQSEDATSPSVSRTLLVTTAVGLFIGLVVVFVKETRARSLISPSQLADLTALPVWSREKGAENEWESPTRMLAMTIDREHWVDLIIDPTDPQARTLHSTLTRSLAETRVPSPRLIDMTQPLAGLLDEVRPSKHVLIAVRGGDALGPIHALLDELALINREVNAMLYLGEAEEAASAPRPEPAVHSAYGGPAEVVPPGRHAGMTSSDDPEETLIQAPIGDVPRHSDKAVINAELAEIQAERGTYEIPTQTVTRRVEGKR